MSELEPVTGPLIAEPDPGDARGMPDAAPHATRVPPMPLAPVRLRRRILLLPLWFAAAIALIWIASFLAISAH
ncbi:hypothetical protein [Schumannella sp. 10F1B-5-1]|uniref:hypothetical protein n=1 Tax=Schumannella sp. 10F1B-5-1 TaxID=2590780 RepID=UPI0011314706|nr:hypothetical protein [Schumannella sp. 10F1B-5-1]TPW78298.1 hypothetical protein FJ658_00370 [Schumannella sp. 10F1B-5-1]